MFRFALLLRCLLIVALCLDGSVGVWRATGMATSMAGHAVANEPSSHPAEFAAADQDCEGAKAPQSSTAGKPGTHDECDCAKNGCSCACALTGIAFAHAIPFAAQHALVAKPAVALRAQAVREFSTTVFRPPIG